MSNIINLAKKSSYYLATNILIATAGFISFPIWTRAFSRYDYGVLCLIEVIIAGATPFAKSGIQNAAVRFYPEYYDQNDRREYYTTMLLGTCLVSGLLSFIGFIFIKVILIQYFNPYNISLMLMACIIVFIDSLGHMMLSFYRAEERVKIHSFVRLIQRYGNLCAAIILVVVFSFGLYGFYMGRIIASVIILIVSIIILYNQNKINVNSFSSSLFMESLTYGFPIIWLELSNIVLSLGDRYVINYYLGPEAVGLYSAGYNLSDNIISVISTSLRLAIVPMYLSILKKHGPKETGNYLSSVLNYYFMIGIPIVFGFTFLGKEIIAILASKKYLDAHIVIPYVTLGAVIYGAYPIIGAGLYIKKKTKVLMLLMLSTGIVNVVLNIILVPYSGILGAAIATLICYVLLAALVAYSSFSLFPFRIGAREIATYTLLSLFMVLFISLFKYVGPLGLLVNIILGGIFYSVGIIIINQKIRMKILLVIRGY